MTKRAAPDHDHWLFVTCRPAAQVRTTDNRRATLNRGRIGDVTGLTGLSVDTLRDYEKINLLGSIEHTAAGLHFYTDKAISLLNFARGTQKMNFSLAEIASLLTMREDPQGAGKGRRR